MTNDCWCDYDRPDWWHSKVVMARKQHKCDECACPIRPGDRYEYVAGKWEGAICEFKTCVRCLALRRYVMDMVPCFCWAHGNLHEDAANTIDEYRHELPGLWFGFARRQVAINKYAAAHRAWG